MASEESNDKLDGIIQFFVRERESKIHYITFDKEYHNSRHANFLAAIAIVAAIIYFFASANLIQIANIMFLVNLLIVGMIVADIYVGLRNRQLDNEYKNTTHKFDVIIGYLQTSNISGKQIETSKLIKLMEEKPKEFIYKNNLYKTWLDKIFDYIIKINDENTHPEMHIENSG